MKKFVVEINSGNQMHLFAPGPIRIPEVIKHTFLVDPPYFTSSAFSDLIREIQPKLQTIFTTTDPVLIGTGSGSLGMEMAVWNFFNSKDHVVVVDSGKYGSNWVKMCQGRDLDVAVVKPKPRHPVTLVEIAKVIKPETRGIFITHVETTTGVLHPIKEVADEFGENCLIVVDAVSSLLTEPLVASDYDVVISASQKAISIPPGLFFMSVSTLARNRAYRCDWPPFYFDVTNELDRLEKGITTFTPASNLYLALNQALNEILKVGVSNLIGFTRSMAYMTREKLSRDFDFYPKVPGNAVTVCDCEGSNLLIQRAYNEGVVIGAGVRELSDKIFRIMHFGWDLKEKELNNVIKNVLLLYNPYP